MPTLSYIAAAILILFGIIRLIPEDGVGVSKDDPLGLKPFLRKKK